MYFTWDKMAEDYPIVLQIQSKLGPGTFLQPEQGPASIAWPLQSFDLIWTAESGKDANLRGLWHARSKGGVQPVIVVAPSPQQDRVRVLGPQDPQTPIRTIPLVTLLQIVEESRSLPRRQAAAVLASRKELEYSERRILYG